MANDNKIKNYTPEYLEGYNLESDLPGLGVNESLEASNLGGWNQIIGNINGLSSRITQTESDITLEVTNRTNADNTLQASITVEANRITQEVTDRTNGDTTLQASITVEANRITQEVTDRTNADTTLQSSITINADNIALKVSKNDVINQINISTEGILIDASNIQINGSTTFSSGYDPTEKETPSGAQAKVDTLSGALGDLAYDDLVGTAKLDSTVIVGGYIKTSLINAGAISIGSFSGDIGDVPGDLDDISDGDTYKRVTSNEKTGADRAYGALNSSDRYKKWLASDDITETKSTSSYTGVFIDSTGLKGYDGGTKTFEISASTGDAYFSGEIGGTGATITGDVQITSAGSLFIGGTGTGMFLENTTSGPGIAFYDSNQSAGFLVGSAFISVSVGSFSTTLTGVEITKDLIVDQDLFVEDDLIVKDDMYVGGTLNAVGGIDLGDTGDITNVDNIYINDLYAQGSFIYVRDPVIFSGSTTTLEIPNGTSSGPEENGTGCIYYNSSTNKIGVYDGGWKWTAALT